MYFYSTIGQCSVNKTSAVHGLLIFEIDPSTSTVCFVKSRSYEVRSRYFLVQGSVRAVTESQNLGGGGGEIYTQHFVLRDDAIFCLLCILGSTKSGRGRNLAMELRSSARALLSFFAPSTHNLVK